MAIRRRRKDGDYDFLFHTVQDERVQRIQTSDLTIPKKYKSKAGALNVLAPFSSEELEWLFKSKYMQIESRRLWAELSVSCGLRADEVARFPEDAVESPSLSNKGAFPVKIIGKFTKERTILVPRFMMERLWQFKNSPERLRRAAKWDLHYGTNKARNLFLNRSGKAINTGSITNISTKVASELAVSGIKFNKSFHDLRSTFATTLAKFMIENHLPLGFIQYRLMSLMGHDNFSTTLKYINFSRDVTFEKQMQDWINRIFSDLRPFLEKEAKARANEVKA